VIRELRSGGLSLQEVADHLNASGETTRQGKPWNKVLVLRVLSA
jgi:hypothetical protein